MILKNDNTPLRKEYSVTIEEGKMSTSGKEVKAVIGSLRRVGTNGSSLYLYLEDRNRTEGYSVSYSSRELCNHLHNVLKAISDNAYKLSNDTEIAIEALPDGRVKLAIDGEEIEQQDITTTINSLYKAGEADRANFALESFAYNVNSRIIDNIVI